VSFVRFAGKQRQPEPHAVSAAKKPKRFRQVRLVPPAFPRNPNVLHPGGQHSRQRTRVSFVLKKKLIRTGVAFAAITLRVLRNCDMWVTIVLIVMMIGEASCLPAKNETWKDCSLV